MAKGFKSPGFRNQSGCPAARSKGMDVGVSAKGIVFKKPILFFKNSLAADHFKCHGGIIIINGNHLGVAEFMAEKHFSFGIERILVDHFNLRISMALGTLGQPKPQG